MNNLNKNINANMPENVRNVDAFCRIILPKIFVEAAGNLITLEISSEGITLTPATAPGQKIHKVERGYRVYLPRQALRVYGNPVKMKMEFLGGRPDALLLTPVAAFCAKCGATVNLRDVHNREIFICINCLNKAFDLRIPLDYADNSF